MAWPFLNVRFKERKGDLASATSKTTKVIAGNDDIISDVVKKALVEYLNDNSAVDVDDDAVDGAVVECNNVNLIRFLFT